MLGICIIITSSVKVDKLSSFVEIFLLLKQLPVFSFCTSIYDFSWYFTIKVFGSPSHPSVSFAALRWKKYILVIVCTS